jgi:hypothetical protein
LQFIGDAGYGLADDAAQLVQVTGELIDQRRSAEHEILRGRRCGLGRTAHLCLLFHPLRGLSPILLRGLKG